MYIFEGKTSKSIRVCFMLLQTTILEQSFINHTQISKQAVADIYANCCRHLLKLLQTSARTYIKVCANISSGLHEYTQSPARIYVSACEYGVSGPRVRCFRAESAQSQARECAVASPRVRGRRAESAQSQARECAVASPRVRGRRIGVMYSRNLFHFLISSLLTSFRPPFIRHSIILFIKRTGYQQNKP